MLTSPSSPALHLIADAERRALVDLMRELGPDAPTLCDGWTVLDLAAHLVVRERRPDAVPGVFGGPLARHTGRVMASVAARGLDAALATISSGPPRLVRLVPGGTTADFVELLVHHEDVRRAAGMGPRQDVPDLQRAAWRAVLGQGRASLLRKPVGVVAVRPDGVRRVLRAGAYPVVLTGEPVELLLLALGRDAHAEVDVSGPSLSVRRFKERSTGI